MTAPLPNHPNLTWGDTMKIWRDIDNERAKFGLTLRRTGGEVHVGRRLYRWRYTR